MYQLVKKNFLPKQILPIKAFHNYSYSGWILCFKVVGKTGFKDCMVGPIVWSTFSLLVWVLFKFPGFLYSEKVHLIKVLSRAFIACYKLLILRCATLLTFHRVRWKGTLWGITKKTEDGLITGTFAQSCAGRLLRCINFFGSTSLYTYFVGFHS